MKKTIQAIGTGVWHIATNRVLFAVMYFLVAFLESFPFLGETLDLVSKGMFLWGIALLGYDLVTRRKGFSGAYAGILVLFCLSYVVTLALNPARLYDGIKHLIYNGILLFLVYPFDREIPYEQHKRTLLLVGDVLQGALFAASLLSLWMFVQQQTVTFTVGDTTFHLGVVYNRLHGVYVSANVGALYAALSLALTAVTGALQPSRVRRFWWAYAINAAVQFFYYTLTLSRGGLLAFLALIGSAAAVLLYPALAKRMKPICALLCMTVCLLGAVALLQGATVGSRALATRLPVWFGTVQTEDNTATLPDGERDPDDRPGSVQLDRVETDGDLTNGRVAIWSAGLKLMSEHPIFGVAEGKIYYGDEWFSGIDPARFTEAERETLKHASGYMHNAAVQLLVCAGAAGLVLFLWFAVRVLLRYCRGMVQLQGTAYARPLSAVFVVLCVFVSQFPAEAHLLFNRQDPLAVLFWLYLGFGMWLVTQGTGEHPTRDNLFIAFTPYQLMQAIKLAQQFDTRSDLYLIRLFQDADGVAQRVRETGIFDRVTVFDMVKKYPPVLQKFVTVLWLLFPRQTMKRYARSPLSRDTYRRVLLTSYLPLMDSVKLTQPQAVFEEYEDGIRNYYHDDTETRLRTGLFAFINKTLLGNRLTFAVKTVYLSHPDAYTGTQFETVRPIVPLADTAVLRQVFGYTEQTQYAAHRRIYLTQPLGETVLGDRAYTREQPLLTVLPPDTLMRVHPRQPRSDYAGFEADEQGNLWELECAETLTDDHCLISAFSTALFTPKMLCDKEPTVIFTYALYGEAYADFAATAEMLRRMYRHPERVKVPKTVEELQTLLS